MEIDSAFVHEPRKAVSPAPRRWLRYTGETIAVLVVLLCIFHRPLLLYAGRVAVQHFAAKAHLKVDLRLEGSVFTDLAVRNLHVTPTGATIVEAADVDYLRADYSLLNLLLHGTHAFLHSVEVRGAHVVLNPATAAVQANVPPDQPLTLPTIFPDRVVLQDVNVIFRSKPQDFVLQGLDLEIDQHHPGELRIAKLQLPTTNAWTQITGHTSYENKNLLIRDVMLDQADQFREIGIDASHIAQQQLGISINASLAGGTLVGSADLKQVQRTLQTEVHAKIENISLDTVRGYIGRREGELTGTVDSAVVNFSGLLAQPKSWNGTVSASLRDVTQGEISFDRATLAITARDGVARLDLGEIAKGPNSIRLKGSADLPADIREFGRTPATLEIGAALPDLHAATEKFAQPLHGAVNVTGHADIRDGVVKADLDFNGGGLVVDGNHIGQVNGNITATKQMPPPNTQKPYYADLNTRLTLNASDVQAAGVIGDSVHAEITTKDDRVAVQQLTADRKQNTVTLSGSYELPKNFSTAADQPVTLNLQSRVVEAADFFPENAPHKLRGPVQVDGQLTMQNGRANGRLQFSGKNLHVDKLAVPQVNADAVIQDNLVRLEAFTAKLNERDSVTASGTFSLDKPYRYDGRLHVDVADLKTLQPLLATNGKPPELGGSLVIDWQGNGTAADFKNTGQLKLALENGRYASMDKLQAKVDASYTPEALDVPLIFLGSDKMDFQAALQAKGDQLEISKIQVDQGTAKYATGYIAFPFVWSNAGTDQPMFPDDGKVVLSVQSENLDLKRLFEDVGQKAPVTGLLNLKIDANSTLADLSARLHFALRDVRSDAANLEPATLDLGIQLEHNRLTAAGKLQQAKVSPIAITADMPVDVPRILREKTFDIQTPISAKVEMPRSSVNFLRQFVPALTQLDGVAAMNVNVRGTIARPELSGAADVTVNVARFSNETLPALTGFNGRFAFSGDTLNFERCDGQLAGGPFRVSGHITFPRLTEPTFDLQVRADSVLLARNDTVTMRADAAIQVAGPLATAFVTGNVSLTNSHVFKNLDLIPIGVPGRPAPQPPSDRPTLSFPQPPIRDWKFDIAIKTKDPVELRGNLASGGAMVDLHLTGTGLHPVLEGQVRLKDVEATLPFSRLEIQYGYLYFNPDDPLNPKIDLHGTSLIRDYTVNVYVYGTTLAPEAVFTSEPPLPQEEIISLLATGTTREELTGSNNVLAGKAAMLLFTQLYHKIFKKGDQPKSNSVFDRLQVDVGSVDPRTGQQTATARYKVDQHWVLLGQIEVGGDFRGVVKYVLRFR